LGCKIGLLKSMQCIVKRSAIWEACERPSTHGPYSMSDKRLLIVDDEADFGDFIRRVATDLGYEVLATTTGSDFQKSYAGFQPTLVILDMVIPDIDGNELLLWLLAQGYTAELIITTGFNPDYAREAKILAEFKGMKKVTIMVKPVSLARLRSTLGS